MLLADHVSSLVEIEMLAYFFTFHLSFKQFVICAISSDLSINL